MGFFLVLRQRETGASVCFRDLANYFRRFTQRLGCGALEFEEQAVLFGPLADGHAIVVRRSHGLGIEKLDTFCS